MPHAVYELWVGYDDSPELVESYTDGSAAIQAAEQARKCNEIVEIRVQRSDRVGPTDLCQ